jgi:Zn-finger nucleic acid-binding protein
MTAPVYRCIQCRTSLTTKNYKQKIWYQCSKCYSGFVPIEFFTAILSEFEFNKLSYSIQKAQIKSSRLCPACKTQMTKIIDVAGANEVEACVSCNLLWLDPNEGLKIKADQEALKNREVKIKMPSNLQPELIDKIEEEVALDETTHPIDKIIYPHPKYFGFSGRQRLGVFTVAPAATHHLIRWFRLEKLSEKYPLLAFLLGMAILILVIKFIGKFFPNGIRRISWY